MSKELEAKLKLAETTINELTEENESLKKQLAEANDSIAVQKQKVATATKSTKLPEPFKYDGKLLQLTSSEFYIPKIGNVEAVKVAEEPKKYAELIDKLLKNKSSLIKAVDK